MDCKINIMKNVARRKSQKRKRRIKFIKFGLLEILLLTTLSLSLAQAQDLEDDRGDQVNLSVETGKSTPPLSAVEPCLLTSIVCGYEKQNQQVFGYSSSVDQTDSTPFRTANGTRVKEGIIANNCFDFGTKVIVQGKEYEVQDRMNERYGCNDWDIWRKTRKEAKNWGHPYLTIEVLN